MTIKYPVPEYSYIFRDGITMAIDSRGTTRIEIKISPLRHLTHVYG